MKKLLLMSCLVFVGCQATPSAAGPAGPAGPTGAMGAPGTDGNNGTNGTAGTMGAMGSMGLPGAQGSRGSNGASPVVASVAADAGCAYGGVSITDPTDGGVTYVCNGAPGTGGMSGDGGVVTGPPGPQGPQGIQGPQGVPGTPGAPGTPGTPGAAGINGSNGAQGAAGPQGVAGAPGPAGPNELASFDFNEATTSTTSADGSGSGNNLAINAVGSAITASGHAGNGLLLDGISGFASAAPGIMPLTTELTVSAWVFRTAAGGTSQTIIARENQFTLGIINGQAQLAVQTVSGGTWVYLGNGTIPLNVWTHVAGSYDGVGIRIFINGMLTSYNAYAGGPISTPAATLPLRVGNRSGTSGTGSTELLTGRLDEIRVMPRAIGRGLFPRYYRAQGYLTDPTDVGAVFGRSLTIPKRTDGTNLRVTWSDNFRVNVNNQACRWEVYFNGAPCTSPGGLYFDKYEGNTSSNRHDPHTFVGTCFATGASVPLPTGNVVVSGRVGRSPGYFLADCETGWQNQLYNLEAEEVQ